MGQLAEQQLNSSIGRVLELFNRSDVTKLRKPGDSKNFYAAMKSAAAIWGAQGHHIFEQEELKKAFHGRTEDLYLRTVKRLNDVGIHINDSSRNIIAAHGNQKKGTTHRNIHDLYKQIPDINYSNLSEDQLFETLVERAVTRKRIAASMIDQTIKGLYAFDPDLKLFPPEYLARYVKDNPDLVHNVTKQIPLKMPNPKMFPTNTKGGLGTITVPGRVRDFLKVGHAQDLGKGGYLSVDPLKRFWGGVKQNPLGSSMGGIYGLAIDPRYREALQAKDPLQAGLILGTDIAAGMVAEGVGKGGLNIASRIAPTTTANTLSALNPALQAVSKVAGPVMLAYQVGGSQDIRKLKSATPESIQRYERETGRSATSDETAVAGLSEEESRQYLSGGGNAAMTKYGWTMEQTMQQGRKNLAEQEASMYKNGGYTAD
jgi:hypothetical protein